MLYNLSDPLALKTFKLRVEALEKKGGIVELTDKSSQRTPSQNNYLHLLLCYAAARLGEQMEYVKRVYFKHCANAEIFNYTEYDKILGKEVVKQKSTNMLTKEEMSDCIDRFKKWCATVPADPFVLPDAENEWEIAAARLEIERFKKWI